MKKNIAACRSMVRCGLDPDAQVQTVRQEKEALTFYLGGDAIDECQDTLSHNCSFWL